MLQQFSYFPLGKLESNIVFVVGSDCMGDAVERFLIHPGMHLPSPELMFFSSLIIATLTPTPRLPALLATCDLAHYFPCPRLPLSPVHGITGTHQAVVLIDILLGERIKVSETRKQKGDRGKWRDSYERHCYHVGRTSGSISVTKSIIPRQTEPLLKQI